MVKIFHPGNYLIGVEIDLPSSHTDALSAFTRTRLGRFSSSIQWKKSPLCGDRVCLSARIIKPWQQEFLLLLGGVVDEYQSSIGL